MASSNSMWLLNKKGPLATVWVAAVRRVEALTRDEVASTDIVASVDKMLQDAQAPQRILALLLLGIAKIHFRKTQFLCDDCCTIFHTFEPRRRSKPSTSTGRSVQGKEAIQRGRQKDTNKVTKSIHTMRITKISGSISSEGLPLRKETEINVQTSVVIRETCVPVEVPAFTIPERFELDAFDLGVADDMYDDDHDHHHLGHQDISLTDERRHAPLLYEEQWNLRAVSSYAVDSYCLIPEYVSPLPEVIGATSEVNNFLYLSTKGHEPERENQSADSVWFTPVKDILPPETMAIIAEGKNPSNKSKMHGESMGEVNMDEDAGPASSILLQESQEQQISENVMENITSARPSASEESENSTFLEELNTDPHVGEFHEHETEENELLGKSNTELPVEGFQENKAEEHESLEPLVLSCKTQAIADLSPSTPEPLPDGIPGPLSSSTFMVRTPTKRSSAIKRKRKYYSKEDYLPTDREEKRKRRKLIFPKFDEAPILSNDMMKIAIRDASDLRRTKRARLTCLGTWKVAKIGSLPDNFMEPLISYQTPVNHASLTTPEVLDTSYGESVKARRRLSYKVSESSPSCNGATERESFHEPRKRTLGEPTNVEAHVGCYKESGHLQDDVYGRKDDTAKEKDTQGDELSVIPSDKGLQESESHNLLHNEALYAAPSPYNIGEDTPMDDCCFAGLLSSIRTRNVARSLHKLFHDPNSNQRTNSLSLNHVLEGIDKRTSAIFFYETLVLKSRDLIKVNQEQPYADIMLAPTPQFEAELQD